MADAVVAWGTTVAAARNAALTSYFTAQSQTFDAAGNPLITPSQLDALTAVASAWQAYNVAEIQAAASRVRSEAAAHQQYAQQAAADARQRDQQAQDAAVDAAQAATEAAVEQVEQENAAAKQQTIDAEQAATAATAAATQAEREQAVGQANADAARATSDTHAAAKSDRDDATARHGAQKDRIANEKERRDGEIDADLEKTTGEIDALTKKIKATADANKTEATTTADATKEKEKADSDAFADRINEKSKQVLGQLKKDVQADRDAIANRPVEQFSDIPAPVPVRPLKMRRPSQAAFYAELTWEVVEGYHLGGLQGVLNIANGLTDIGIGLINEIVNTGSLWMRYGTCAPMVSSYQYLREFTGWDPLPFLPQRVTVIGEWDWSRGMITHESDRGHWWSKFLGGQGALQLITMGLSNLWSGANAARATKATTNATRAAAVEAEYAAAGEAAGGRVFTRREILLAFRRADHTPASRAILEGINNGTIRLVVRKIMDAFGGAARNTMRIRQVGKIEDLVNSVVHEGRHLLDIVEARIPPHDPVNARSLFAELRAYRESGRFAVRNGYTGSRAYKFGIMEITDAADEVIRINNWTIGNSPAATMTIEEVMAVISELELWW